MISNYLVEMTKTSNVQEISLLFITTEISEIYDYLFLINYFQNNYVLNYIDSNIVKACITEFIIKNIPKQKEEAEKAFMFIANNSGILPSKTHLICLSKNPITHVLPEKVRLEIKLKIIKTKLKNDFNKDSDYSSEISTSSPPRGKKEDFQNSPPLLESSYTRHLRLVFFECEDAMNLFPGGDPIEFENMKKKLWNVFFSYLCLSATLSLEDILLSLRQARELISAYSLNRSFGWSVHSIFDSINSAIFSIEKLN